MLLLLLAAAQASAADAPSLTTVQILGNPPSLVVGHPPATPKLLTLVRDTPIELMAVSEVSTADVAPGTIFKLRVNRAVAVNGVTVVPVGTTAFGEVITATDSGGLGKSGRMTARLRNLRLGEIDIPLEGEMSAKGTGAGSAGVAILFAGVAGLFHRGNNAKIKAGEILAGFIAEDVTLDLAGSTPCRASTPAVSAPVAPLTQ